MFRFKLSMCFFSDI